jgi:hypothetical protein
MIVLELQLSLVHCCLIDSISSSDFQYPYRKHQFRYQYCFILITCFMLSQEHYVYRHMVISYF